MLDLISGLLAEAQDFFFFFSWHAKKEEIPLNHIMEV